MPLDLISAVAKPCRKFGHANANFSVFIDRIRSISKEMNNDSDLIKFA